MIAHGMRAGVLHMSGRQGCTYHTITPLSSDAFFIHLRIVCLDALVNEGEPDQPCCHLHPCCLRLDEVCLSRCHPAVQGGPVQRAYVSLTLETVSPGVSIHKLSSNDAGPQPPRGDCRQL
jgi:hypothetical protein